MDSTHWKEVTEAKMTLRELYDRTGVFPMGYNVLSRLTAEFASGELSRGMDAQFASITSLFEFLLTGHVSIEHSMAGATVLMDPAFQDWNRPLLKTLGIPLGILPEIVPPGTIGAPLLPKLAEELGCPDCRYIHTVEFDASAAMVSAPGLTKDSIYLSMGSTINPGVLLKQPVISDAALEYRYKNAPVWPGSVMLMSDVPGFFILQECLDLWKKSDPSLGHGELVKLAEASRADAVVDLFDPRFSTTKDNMPACIRECCRETGQNVPETIGDVARVLYLSYATAVAWSLDKLKMITGKSDYREIIAVSGGSRNALLCQMIADASGMTVRAGDPKATCLGNLLVQFYALGKLDSYEAMQAEAADFCEMKTYTPVTGK
jgi:rhamnulokinase